MDENDTLPEKYEPYGALVYNAETEEGEVLFASTFVDVSEVPTIIQLDLLKDWIEALTELYSDTLESFETKH